MTLLVDVPFVFSPGPLASCASQVVAPAAGLARWVAQKLAFPRGAAPLDATAAADFHRGLLNVGVLNFYVSDVLYVAAPLYWIPSVFALEVFPVCLSIPLVATVRVDLLIVPLGGGKPPEVPAGGATLTVRLLA